MSVYRRRRKQNKRGVGGVGESVKEEEEEEEEDNRGGLMLEVEAEGTKDNDAASAGGSGAAAASHPLSASISFHHVQLHHLTKTKFAASDSVDALPSAPPMDDNEKEMTERDSEYAARLGYSNCAEILREDEDDDNDGEELDGESVGRSSRVMYADIEFGTTYVDREEDAEDAHVGGHPMHESIILAMPSAPPPDDCWEDDDGDGQMDDNDDDDESMTRGESNKEMLEDDYDDEAEKKTGEEDEEDDEDEDEDEEEEMDEIDLFQRSDVDEEEEIVTAAPPPPPRLSFSPPSPLLHSPVHSAPSPKSAGAWYDQDPSTRRVFTHHIPTPVDSGAR